jgi:hypothetical protein
MARMDLQSYDSLFLLNVERPDLSRLASFLEMGRPVFLFLGDRIDPAVYNRFSFAPWQIREKIDLDAHAEENIQIDSGLETPKFVMRLKDSLKHASFRSYFKVEGTGKHLLSLKNKDPLLMAVEAGNSRLFMFTSSADLAWNDLPLKAAYLPLIRGSVKEAIGQTETSLPEGITVGEAFTENGRPLQLKGPPGGPGIFQFRRLAGEPRRGVNTPAEESDLAKITVNELKKKFGAIDVKVIEYQEGGLIDLQGGRKVLWPPLLIFLLAVLTVETILANGIPRFKG